MRSRPIHCNLGMMSVPTTELVVHLLVAAQFCGRSKFVVGRCVLFVAVVCVHKSGFDLMCSVLPEMRRWWVDFGFEVVREAGSGYEVDNIE